MTNTELNLTGIEVGDVIRRKDWFPNPIAPQASNSIDLEQAQLTTSADRENTAALGNWQSVVVPKYINDVANARHAGKPEPPKPIAAASVQVVRQDIKGCGTWLAEIYGEAVGVCPDAPAPVAQPTPTIVSTVPGQQSYDQRFNALTSLAITANVKLDAVLKHFGITVALVLAILLSVHTGYAQVHLKFSPEPMAVATSQLAGARDMGRWLIEGCNDGAAPVTLTSERVSMASAMAWIDADDALMVLVAHQKRSAAAWVLKILQYAGQGAAIALAVASKSNYAWSTGLSIGSGVLPQITQIVQGEVPSVTPLLSGVKYPLTLGPGGCFTDHRFAGKMKKPVVTTAEVK